MGAKRFGFGGLAVAVLVTGVLVHNETENPGGTSRGFDATKQIGLDVTSEVAQVAPEVRAAVQPLTEMATGLAVQAGTAAGAEGVDPATGGSSAADGGGGGQQ